MASKAQIVDYIVEKYRTSDGMPVSMSKLDSYKKGDLEKFIKSHKDEENLNKWVSQNK